MRERIQSLTWVGLSQPEDIEVFHSEELSSENGKGHEKIVSGIVCDDCHSLKI